MDTTCSHLVAALGAAFVGLVAFAAPAAGQGSPCAWDTGSPLPVARMEGPSAVLDGKLWVFGGFVDPALNATTRVDVWDPATDAWSQRAPLPVAVTHAALAVDGSRVWLAGGFVGQHPGPVTAAVHVYDAQADAWSAAPPLPKPVAGGALVLVGRALHYFGGVEADRDTDSPDHWVLDADQPVAWLPRAPLPAARCHLAGAELGGLVYAVGGQHGHDTAPQDLDHVHAYDPATDTWSARASLPTPRSHFEPGTFVHQGRLCIAGGRDNSAGLPALADLLAYEPAADVWSPLPALHAPLLAPVAKVLAGELVVAAGGPAPDQPTAEVRRRAADAQHASVQRYNAGGSAWMAPGDEPWCGDHGFLGGVSWVNGFVGDVAGTVRDELYASERNSGPEDEDLAYRLPVEPGAQRVVLHFAEIWFGAPGGGGGGVGSRVFDIVVEGAPVLDDHDIYAAVGPAAADVHAWEAWIPDGALDVRLEREVDRPKLSGLEVERLEGAPFEAFCEHGPGARIGFVGSTSVARDELHLTVSGAQKGQPGIFFFARGATSTPLGAGLLCAAPPVRRLYPVLIPGADGVVTRRVSLAAPHPQTGPITPGSTRVFQYWHRRADALLYDTSDALRITFGP